MLQVIWGAVQSLVCVVQCWGAGDIKRSLMFLMEVCQPLRHASLHIREEGEGSKIIRPTSLHSSSGPHFHQIRYPFHWVQILQCSLHCSNLCLVWGGDDDLRSFIVLLRTSLTPLTSFTSITPILPFLANNVDLLSMMIPTAHTTKTTTASPVSIALALCTLLQIARCR